MSKRNSRGLAVYQNCRQLNLPVRIMCFKGLDKHYSDIVRLIAASIARLEFFALALTSTCVDYSTLKLVVLLLLLLLFQNCLFYSDHDKIKKFSPDIVP